VRIFLGWHICERIFLHGFLTLDMIRRM